MLRGENMGPVLGHVLGLEISRSGVGKHSKEAECNCPRLVELEDFMGQLTSEVTGGMHLVGDR